MPANIKLYDGTTDPEDHLSRFASAASSGEWPMPVWYLREAFAARYSVRRVCFKESHEITKIVRKANESLTAFKERWTVKTSFIMGVLEVMNISSFMDSVKSPELAKRFLDKVTATVKEMMERLDDFVRSEEAYASTELLKRDTGEEKAYYKNDCIQLKNQLEMALESGKLNYFVKDVRQRGKGIPWQGCSPTSKDNQCDKCELCEREKTEGEGDDRVVDEHPNILPGDILGGHFRRAFDRRSRVGQGRHSPSGENITKENKHKYRVDPGCGGSFPINEEAHYETPFVNSALGKRNPIRILGKRNYAPMENLALSLIHMTRRLRRYFESQTSHMPRLPKTLMTSIMAPWPFYQLGMDILGPLPPARGGAKFVIVAVDYFTKWIEDKPLVRITGKELVNDPFKSWCGRFEIHHMNTAVAHPQANGLVKRANRSLIEGIKTRLEREKAGWVDELPNVLWTHRTLIKQSNGETPFSLSYGSEAVILAEIGIPTYQTLMTSEGYNEDEMRLNLDILHERRETAAIRETRYKTKMEQYYKKVRSLGFRPGEFVL
nr:reverse transcriptase domain-containing protein [Tanacetum cinerariifolium]